jgi:two-component system nitrogen regulation response regulator GlnG
MSKGVVLLADDDRAILTVLTQALSRAGWQVQATSAASTLWGWIQDGEGDVVLTDVMMPDGDALDLLPAIKRRRPELPVLVMSAQNTVLTAIRSGQAGAFDYFPKPFDLKEVIALLDRATTTVPYVDDAPIETSTSEATPLIGRSAAMQEVYRILARLTPTELSVMITGQSGTGKELVARALHEYGRRKEGPFVAVNMAAIPRELIESTLFGHEKGAFTGATERAVGKFEMAQGGSLFLDEIGDMPAEAQTRLLRVLQEGEFTPVGGRAPRRADVRIIAATHQDLRTLIREGRFREDLYFRLNVVPVHLPSLSERREDIPDLARAFLRRAAEEGLPAKRISQDAIAALQALSWPGNVRELENLMRRMAAMAPEESIDAEAVRREIESGGRAGDRRAAGGAEPNNALSQAVQANLEAVFRCYEPGVPPNGLYERVLAEVELPLISMTLSACRGNQVRAAEVLGINRNTLRKKIRDLDIEVTRGKRTVVKEQQ